MVEFKAMFYDQGGNISVHHERSSFERINGKWVYSVGDVQ